MVVTFQFEKFNDDVVQQQEGKEEFVHLKSKEVCFDRSRFFLPSYSHHFHRTNTPSLSRPCPKIPKKKGGHLPCHLMQLLHMMVGIMQNCNVQFLDLSPWKKALLKLKVDHPLHLCRNSPVFHNYLCSTSQRLRTSASSSSNGSLRSWYKSLQFMVLCQNSYVMPIALVIL